MVNYFAFGILACFAAVCLIPGIHRLYIGILCRKEENLHWVLGTLISTKDHRNVYEPGTWQTKKLAHYTHFEYAYCVDGKKYALRGALGVAPGMLPKCPRITYLRQSPRYAKINGVWEFHELPMGLFLTSGGLFFTVFAIIALAC